MTVGQSRVGTRAAKRAVIAALCMAATALAGCGGSSGDSSPSPSGTRSTRTDAARPTPATSNADVGGTEAQRSGAETETAPGGPASVSANRRHAARPSRSGKVQHGFSTAASSDDLTASSARRVNPCSLVTKHEAQTITGRTVSSTLEAPLGPTCIYSFGGTKTQVMLSVQPSSFASVARQMADRRSLTIKGRSAYCGRLGLPALVLALPSGSSLNVAAPCGIATGFAALAVGRLPA